MAGMVAKSEPGRDSSRSCGVALAGPTVLPYPPLCFWREVESVDFELILPSFK